MYVKTSFECKSMKNVVVRSWVKRGGGIYICELSFERRVKFSCIICCDFPSMFAIVFLLIVVMFFMEVWFCCVVFVVF